MSKKSSSRSRLFIGSSTESLDFAYAIQQNLEDDVEVTVWKQGVFELTKNTLEALTRALDRSDFGAFVFAPTDVVRLNRGNISPLEITYCSNSAYSSAGLVTRVVLLCA